MEVPSRIEHHLDYAVHRPARGWQARNIQAELAGDRRTDLIGAQVFALDRGGLDHLLGQDRQTGLGLEVKTQGLHLPEVPLLMVPDRRERSSEGLVIPPEGRPIGLFMDIGHIQRTFCGDYIGYSPQNRDLRQLRAENHESQRNRKWG